MGRRSEGLFRDEGLDYEFDAQGFASASSAAGDAAPMTVRSGAFEDMQQGRACEVSSACHWAVNAAASGGHGRMWGKAYSVCAAGHLRGAQLAVRAAGGPRRAQVGVGYHSGSHYSAIQALEPFLERDIALSFVGRPWDRVRLMLDRKIEAANVFGPQYYVLEQLGFRKLVDTTFVMGFMVAPTWTPRTSRATSGRCAGRSARSISRSSATSASGCASCPRISANTVDVRRFGPGERMPEPYTRDMFERTHRWMEAWELFDPGERQPEYEEAMLIT